MRAFPCTLLSIGFVLAIPNSVASAQVSGPISYGHVRPRSAGNPNTTTDNPADGTSLASAHPLCTLPPPPKAPAEFTIEYRAYIPTDNVTGTTSAHCAASYGQTTAVYAGDQRHDSDVTTYRASIYSILEPGSGTVFDAVPATGITYEFSPPSVVNGVYLTDVDFDGIQGKCDKYTADAQAQFGTNGSETITPTVLSSSETEFTYHGTIQNPLAATMGLPVSIGWNLNTSIELGGDGSYGNVKVTGDVTCYPAHEVLVDGITVASFSPTSNGSTHIANCLLGPDSTPLTGPATTSGGINISTTD